MWRLGLVWFFALLEGCASYHLGNLKRSLPGGYDRVAVPIFVNKTHEVGVETYFTESLRTEFERSRIAKVTSKNDAQVILEGVVTKVTFDALLPIRLESEYEISTPDPVDPKRANPLPANTVISKEYSTTVSVHLVARKVSDNSIIWEGDFDSQRNYPAPLLGTPRLAGSNAIYNQSSRQYTVARLAKDMMSEAHDRITENF